ncbi:hypothetical protein WICMUC_002385 [Wickerhamomyces mucosus]|uniref:Zn(2)-C6 fungal-type domain-containing protein n=1 Tax=Wickerhamomyces mucosus TaxID=1378264 RepID=A0A9P8PPV0_9ASCO|nr:hypothetical protein WICMUC_002385 [Wickerhamomyces mucosus]
MTVKDNSSSTASTALSTGSTNTTKKIIKHSKKFERTQTGCLQCRQKKKKCDGRRPSCLSCLKKGIQCEFPANIRFFQFQANNSNIPKVETAPLIPKQSNKIEKVEVTTKPDVIDKKVERISEPLKVKQIETQYKHQKQHSCCTNTSNDVPELIRSSSVSTISSMQSSQSERQLSFSSILSTEDENSIDPLLKVTSKNPIYLDESRNDSKKFKPIINQSFEKKKQDDEDMNNALHLASEGESISNILNTISIDLIKKSIHNLKYIDFEEKLNNYYQNNSSTAVHISNIIKKDGFLNNHGDHLENNLQTHLELKDHGLNEYFF